MFVQVRHKNSSLLYDDAPSVFLNCCCFYEHLVDYLYRVAKMACVHWTNWKLLAKK